MGLAIVFHTSRGDVLTLQGSQARKRRSFLAPSDAQIVGLQFQGVQIYIYDVCLLNLHIYIVMLVYVYSIYILIVILIYLYLIYT